MKKIATIFLITILAISCNSNKEKELLERELELSKKESKINEASREDEMEEKTRRTAYSTSLPTPSNPANPTESMRSKEMYNPMDYLKMDFNYAGQSYQKGKGLLKIKNGNKIQALR